MTPTRFIGITLLTVGISLLATLLYEPATVAAMAGISRLMDEGVVVLVALAVATVCGLGGVAAIRHRPAAE